VFGSVGALFDTQKLALGLVHLDQRGLELLLIHQMMIGLRNRRSVKTSSPSSHAEDPPTKPREGLFADARQRIDVLRRDDVRQERGRGPWTWEQDVRRTGCDPHPCRQHVHPYLTRMRVQQLHRGRYEPRNCPRFLADPTPGPVVPSCGRQNFIPRDIVGTQSAAVRGDS